MSIEVRDVRFAYGDRPVLKGVSFTVGTGTLASVLGPNGVGKSTLFQCMLGLLKGYKGSIYLHGADARKQDVKALARLAAYIPQAHAPAFHYTVLDMVLMGTTARLSALASPGQEECETALATLAKLGIEQFAKRDYMRLSGGERQLVLIARALAQGSRILIMDEPTANLDYGNQVRVLCQMRDLAEEGYTVLQSTHNPDLAGLFSHQILAMRGGRVIAQGVPGEVLSAELIKKLYGIGVRVESLYGGKALALVPDAAIEFAPRQDDAAPQPAYTSTRRKAP